MTDKPTASHEVDVKIGDNHFKLAMADTEVSYAAEARKWILARLLEFYTVIGKTVVKDDGEEG